MALINQNSIIGVTSITSPSASNVLTVHTNDTTERLRVSTSGVSFSGTNASLDTSGNLTIAGVLTYEDVTSVDSVGLSTFQNGIHVTGGSVGIGTDNPVSKLTIDGTAGAADNSSNIRFTLNGTSEGLYGVANAAGNLVTGSAQGDSVIRNDGGNILFSVDSGTSSALRITSGGSIGIGSDNPTDVLDILTGSSDEVTSLKVKTAGAVELSRNHASAPYIKTFMSSGNPEIRLGDGSGDKAVIKVDGVSYFNGGNIGIGTDAPQGKVDIWGNVVITDQDQGIYFSDPDNKAEYHQIYMSSSDNSLNLKSYSGSWGKRLTIDTTGNIGIGTDNPNHKLTLFQSGTGTFDAINVVTGNTNSTGYQMGINSSGEAFHWNTTNSSINFATNNTERLRIKSDGQLLHTRSDDTTRYDLEFRQTGGITDGNYSGIRWSQGATGSTNLAAIEIEYVNSGRPDIVFKTRQSGGTSMSEAARITSTGSVGIGTDNSEGQLHLNGTTRYVQTISAINGVTAGTTSGTIYRQQYTTDSTSRRMGFFGIKRSAGSGDQRAKFVMELCPDNSTNLGLSAPANNTTAFEFNHNGTILVKSGGGIDFSETSNSSGTMTSELLDDYEEGTFTAVLRSHSTNTTTTGYDTSTNANNATYTKVGRLVTINMEWNNLHNDARAHVLRYIDGLPFTSSSTNRSTAAIGYQRGLYFRYSGSPETTNMHHLYGAIEGNTTQVALNGSKGSSPYSGWPTTHDSASSIYLRLSMQYYV